MEIKLKVFRSRKSSRYFRFCEFYDDGYGEYQDIVDLEDIKKGELPSLFPMDVVRKNLYKFTKPYLDDISEYRPDEIEEVEITITLG